MTFIFILFKETIMAPVNRSWARVRPAAAMLPLLALTMFSAAACAPATGSVSRSGGPVTDPRVGLRGGALDAASAIWNLRLVSTTPPPEQFTTEMNSDISFSGPYAIQGNFNGYQIWDISNPAQPALRAAYVCPASQSDVSIYKNLLFVSGEGLGGRLDCGTQGVKDTVSHDRLRGLRIFDISDVSNPKYIGNVQTCRGSHTHTVLADPRDTENIYVYISGSAGVRSPNELAGCVDLAPDKDPNSALFRIEVIKVPLANPERAAIVSSPRIFGNLVAPARHGETAEDMAAQARSVEAARARGAYIARVRGREQVVGPGFVDARLDSIVKARGGSGPPTAADSATLRAALQTLVDRFLGPEPTGPRPGPTQCHDITVYPAVGLAGGACEGYGFLLDIRDPANPVRIGAVADSNFAYWHSATLNNDGTKILFSDEWGGGGQPKCRATDKPEWGANAIFEIVNRQMQFRSYYKLPAAQTPQENCVAHNGSLIPIPGRDVMVQGWYQGGISVFDWTDASRPKEIAFFDRGPADSTRMTMSGSWSAYWYNGHIISSEISRGLDILELTPSPFISQNEIDAAKSVRFDYMNAQQQPKFEWPPTFALARAYVDQLERSNALPSARLASVRTALRNGENSGGMQRRDALTQLATRLESEVPGSRDPAKMRLLASAVKQLAEASP